MLNKGKALTNADLENVSGGMIVNAQGLEEYDPTCPWEVIENNTGRLLGKMPTRDLAYGFANAFGPEAYNTMEVDTATVLRLRANPQV